MFSILRNLEDRPNIDLLIDALKDASQVHTWFNNIDTEDGKLAGVIYFPVEADPRSNNGDYLRPGPKVPPWGRMLFAPSRIYSG